MFDVSVYSDLFEVGLTEDGESAISEEYFVCLERPEGNRWRHKVSFKGSQMKLSEEGVPYYPDLRDQAREKAEHLAQRVVSHLNNQGIIKFEHWVEIDPAYGSEHYQKLERAGYFRN